MTKCKTLDSGSIIIGIVPEFITSVNLRPW